MDAPTHDARPPGCIARNAHQTYFFNALDMGLRVFGGKDDVWCGPRYSSSDLTVATRKEEPGAVAAWFQYLSRASVAVSGVYWCLGGLALLGVNVKEDGPLGTTRHTQLVAFIKRCHCPSTGGYKPHPNSTNSILATLSAVQALQLLGVPLTAAEQNSIRSYVHALHDTHTGGFLFAHPTTSSWTNEPDLRFVLCALATLFHLGDDLTQLSDVDALVRFILACQNADGGFGGRPQDESHGGFTYCAIASLALLQRLTMLDTACISKLRR